MHVGVASTDSAALRPFLDRLTARGDVFVRADRF